MTTIPNPYACASNAASDGTAVSSKIAADNQGYVDAFYKIGELMGIGAQVEPPKDVFERQMLPALRAALADRNLVLEEAAKVCDRIGGGSPDREDMTEYDLGHQSGAEHCANRIRHMKSEPKP